ncbi:hypothetical protein, partial [Haemophilus sp. HMSC068C11]|uniref:hypothetical protein n=1 Tax=Haemophilus sp. HMSC068C11 TaxID=1739522 RepID=UPI001C559ACD
KEQKRTTHWFFLRFTTARRCVGRIIGLSEFFASAFLQKNSIFLLSDDLIIKVNCLCSIFKVNYHQRVSILMR